MDPQCIGTYIETLKRDLNGYYEIIPNFNFDGIDSTELMRRIEYAVLLAVQCLAAGNSPRYQIHTREGKMRCIDFGKAGSRDKFTVITYLLSKIIELIVSNKSCSKREIYYENVAQLRNQREVDRALNDVAQILTTPIWQLRIHGTAKGLIAGNFSYTLNGRRVLTNEKGSLIPQDVTLMRNFTSSAKWIFLIEKDAAFQTLIEYGALFRLGSCLLITGKGYPDVNTRMLVRRLWEELRIPILALVDADPHGLDIMCVYRFGSLAMSSHSQDLACPAVRWLGVHPTDIGRLSIDSQPLTSQDNTKLQSMLTRSYIVQNAKLLAQVRALLEKQVKSEIEGLRNFSASYLIDSYIPHKLRCQEYI